MTLALLQSPANRAALAVARGEIARNERRFRVLEEHALRAEANGDPLAAAAWALIACQYAVPNTTGLLASPALERLLSRLGREHVPSGRPAPRRPGPERVLHVFTETYTVGGHTRAALRWMERDAERIPTALLLAQVAPLPDIVPATVEARGGRLLRMGPGDLFTRARALRTIAADHDLVVLHVGSQDIVPALAFAAPEGRPPVILFDHSNHTFWIGVGAADVVASIRPADARHAVERRGVDAERALVLPIATAPRTLPDRDAARAVLGLRPDDRVALTIASDYKVRPVLEPAMADLLGAVLDRDPAARALVVGPEPEGPWARLAAASGGRAQVLGPVADIGPHLACADVYVDSWPATGGTTLLDAAAAALPVVALCDGAPELAMVRPAEPALDGALVTARTAAELVERTAALLADPDRARALGRRLRDAADAAHGSGWPARMEAVVAAARQHAGAALPPAGELPPAPAEADCILQLLAAAGGRTTTPQDAALTYLHELPERCRPRSRAELDAAVAAPEPPGGRRAIGAAPREPDGARRLVEALRRARDGGHATSFAVVLPPARLGDGIALLEAALADGDDIDIDVVVADRLDDVRTDDDLVIGA